MAASRGCGVAESDYIVVGSGINGLVCAAMLGLKGRKVLLLERNDRVGGCLRTEAVTVPGFVHDVMATTFVLFVTSPAYAALGPDLEKRGLAFAQSEIPTGGTPARRQPPRPDPLPRGQPRRLRGCRTGRRDGLRSRDGPLRRQRGPGLFRARRSALVEAHAEDIGRRTLAAWVRAASRLFLGEALVSARAHLEGRYTSDLVRALFAPWVLHTGLGPESAYSGEMIKVIGFALEAAGAPHRQGRRADRSRCLLAADPGQGRQHRNRRRRRHGHQRRERQGDRRGAGRRTPPHGATRRHLLGVARPPVPGPTGRGSAAARHR